MLNNKKLFLFDIDGTIAVGNTLYDGSAELIDYISQIGGKAYYITNNSTKSGADYVDKFKKNFHLETTEDLFITSGYMTIRFIKENFSNRKIFVLGTASFVTELKKNGLIVTEQPESDIACILVGYDSELTYEKLVNTCQVLSTMEVPFYATNPDLCCPIDFGFIPDCGAICQMLTSSTGKVPVYLGKPAREVCDQCMKQSGFTPEETIVIGDRLYTDIACGINAGVETCVVYTGEATPEEVAHSEYKPTYAFDNIRQFYEALRTSSSQA
ncbi:MAG: HAD-IIA family hydrolase [Lachnospiraceae bacterium]